ncbi:MAG: hypothetical protein RI994_1233 [Pseudomonadota bacterium]
MSLVRRKFLTGAAVAGGTLAAVSAIMARDAGLKLALQLLMVGQEPIQLLMQDSI